MCVANLVGKLKGMKVLGLFMRSLPWSCVGIVYSLIHQKKSTHPGLNWDILCD